MLAVDADVARIVDLAELVVVVERRRRHVERPAPQHELLLAELGEGLRLVLALQRAVVALVEAPRALDGDPQPVGGVEGDVRRLDGTAENRGVEDVGVQARLGEQLAAALGFGLALLGEPHVDPSGEEVELVPFALAVAEEDQRVGRGHVPHDIQRRSREARLPACHHGLMASGRSPVGQVTRGTTGTNRLRRVDRWIARHPGPAPRGRPARGGPRLRGERRDGAGAAGPPRPRAAGCRGAGPRDRPGARRARPSAAGGGAAPAAPHSAATRACRSRSAASRCPPRTAGGPRSSGR